MHHEELQIEQAMGAQSKNGMPNTDSAASLPVNV
jgi:hypothetical protein